MSSIKEQYRELAQRLAELRALEDEGDTAKSREKAARTLLQWISGDRDLNREVPQQVKRYVDSQINGFASLDAPVRDALREEVDGFIARLNRLGFRLRNTHRRQWSKHYFFKESVLGPAGAVLLIWIAAWSAEPWFVVGAAAWVVFDHYQGKPGFRPLFVRYGEKGLIAVGLLAAIPFPWMRDYFNGNGLPMLGLYVLYLIATYAIVYEHQENWMSWYEWGRNRE